MALVACSKIPGAKTLILERDLAAPVGLITEISTLKVSPPTDGWLVPDAHGTDLNCAVLSAACSTKRSRRSIGSSQARSSLIRLFAMSCGCAGRGSGG